MLSKGTRVSIHAVQRAKLLGIPTIPGYQKYNMKSPQRLKPSSSIYQVKQKSFLHTMAEYEEACFTGKCKTYLPVLRSRMQNLPSSTPQENAKLTFYEDSHTYKCKSEWPSTRIKSDIIYRLQLAINYKLQLPEDISSLVPVSYIIELVL